MVVSIASVVAGDTVSVARTLAELSTVSARPTFELQFSILQNNLLDRLSDKINAYTEDSQVNHVDAFLTLEKNRLERLAPSVDKYVDETATNFRSSSGILDDLYSLQGLASGSDSEAFDALLEQIGTDLSRIKTVSGLSIGLNVKDGMTALRNEGLAISDFANYGDADSRVTAIADVVARVENALSVMTNNLEGALDFKESVTAKITSVTIQIEAVQIADQTERLGEIEKLRMESSRLLTALSLAFETNLARSEAFAEQLLNPPEFNEGTVLDILV